METWINLSGAMTNNINGSQICSSQERILKVPNALVVTTNSHLTLMMFLIGRGEQISASHLPGEDVVNYCNDVWEDPILSTNVTLWALHMSHCVTNTQGDECNVLYAISFWNAAQNLLWWLDLSCVRAEIISNKYAQNTRHVAPPSTNFLPLRVGILTRWTEQKKLKFHQTRQTPCKGVKFDEGKDKNISSKLLWLLTPSAPYSQNYLKISLKHILPLTDGAQNIYVYHLAIPMLIKLNINHFWLPVNECYDVSGLGSYENDCWLLWSDRKGCRAFSSQWKA